MDSKYLYNLVFFLANYIIVCYLSYDNLTRHIFNKNPLFFILVFGLIGLITTALLTKIKTIIPIKLFLTNLFASYISFLLFYTIYDDCMGLECEKNYFDHILMIVYLFVTLKFDIAILVTTILYFIYKFFSNRSLVNDI